MIFLKNYKKYIINIELEISYIQYGYEKINSNLEYDFWDYKQWLINDRLNIKERSKNYSYDLEEAIVCKTSNMRKCLTRERQLILIIYDERIDATNMTNNRAQIMQDIRMRFNILRSCISYTQKVYPTIGKEEMTYNLCVDSGFDEDQF